MQIEGGFFCFSAIPASIAGMIAHFIVSLATPRSTHSFEEIVQEMHRTREAIENVTC
jgi:hypothetical protein